MEKFSFYVDKKITMWVRSYFEIEAENTDDAISNAIEFHKEGGTFDLIGEPIYDAPNEQMYPDENDGGETQVLFLDINGNDSLQLWSNGDE